MEININFFDNQLKDAIGAGVYKIYICIGERERVLYVGESVSVLSRCAQYLFKFNKNPDYFGFKDEDINNSELILKFQLVKNIPNKKERKKDEINLIKSEKPLIQSGINDYMKGKNDKIIAVDNFIKQK